jgi:hypothetical protein
LRPLGAAVLRDHRGALLWVRRIHWRLLASKKSFEVGHFFFINGVDTSISVR